MPLELTKQHAEKAGSGFIFTVCKVAPKKSCLYSYPQGLDNVQTKFSFWRCIKRNYYFNNLVGWKKSQACKAWWHLPIIPGFGKWRQKGKEFKVILGYVVSLKPAWSARNKEIKPTKNSTPTPLPKPKQTQRTKKKIRLEAIFNKTSSKII